MVTLDSLSQVASGCISICQLIGRETSGVHVCVTPAGDTCFRPDDKLIAYFRIYRPRLPHSVKAQYEGTERYAVRLPKLRETGLPL